MTVTKRQGVWFHPVHGGGRIEAMVNEVHEDGTVDVVVDENGTIYGRSNLAVMPNGTQAPGTVELAASDDNVDLDRILRDSRYKLPDDMQPQTDDGA